MSLERQSSGRKHQRPRYQIISPRKHAVQVEALITFRPSGWNTPSPTLSGLWNSGVRTSPNSPRLSNFQRAARAAVNKLLVLRYSHTAVYSCQLSSSLDGFQQLRARDRPNLGARAHSDALQQAPRAQPERLAQVVQSSKSTVPPRNVCQLGAQEPTVGAQGGWLPNFLEVYSGKLGRNVGQKCWAE